MTVVPHMLGQLGGVIGSSVQGALGRGVLETRGGQNVTCLVSFAVHGEGLASPGETSEKFCFLFTMLEQGTAGRKGTRLVGVALLIYF